LFFDESDALVTNREHGGSSGSSTSAEGRVLATFLTEMDGVVGNNSNVFLFAATNRLDCIDKALIRKVRMEIEMGYVCVILCFVLYMLYIPPIQIIFPITLRIL